ncbi:MAG TPA: SUKH-3 domain-containing protein [Actinoplanes sp.]|nr:SUKH-3 domain-containing protein [Actinoplanes sp.]
MSHTESVWPSGITLQRFADPDPLPAAFGTPLPDHVLERIALHWAEAQHIPPTHVIMREAELGYAIWAPGRRAVYSTFIDKVTGRRVGFPNPNRPDKQYANQLEHENGLLPRPGFGGPEVDPPALVAEVSLAEGEAYHPAARAVSARTGEPPALHPLVAARLAAVPEQARVRGVERHAELVALGDALAAADAARAAAGRPPLTAADLADPRLRIFLELHRIRDPADPRTGGFGDPCPTCADILRVPTHRRPVLSPMALTVARLQMHSAPATPAAGVIDRVAAIAGVHGRHEPSPAAADAIGRYLGKHWDVDAPGRQVRRTPFAIDPLTVADSADTLARAAALLGAPLFPLGSAALDGILAIAPDRRVVLVDESGEWLLGTGIRRALDTLMLGRAASRMP